MSQEKVIPKQKLRKCFNGPVLSITYYFLLTRMSEMSDCLLDKAIYSRKKLLFPLNKNTFSPIRCQGWKIYFQTEKIYVPASKI